MENFKREIIVTNDGTSSLFIPEINETYHSAKGAETESAFIYIQNGLELVNPEVDYLNILEIGMGTGLNILLAYEWTKKKGKSLSIVTLEPYPISLEQIASLNYPLTRDDNSKEVFNLIHSSPFDTDLQLAGTVGLKKLKVKLEDYNPPKNQFDVVFYDAFAPSKQDEIWAPELLKKVYDSLKPNGVLTTYCAQGQFKRDLRSIGFEVNNPPGPMGKKEMTVALKTKSYLIS